MRLVVALATSPRLLPEGVWSLSERQLETAIRSLAAAVWVMAAGVILLVAGVVVNVVVVLRVISRFAAMFPALSQTQGG